MAPARSSEKDLKVEQAGLEATGLATTTLSASSISIFNDYVLQSMLCTSQNSAGISIDDGLNALKIKIAWQVQLNNIIGRFNNGSQYKKKFYIYI